MRGLGTSGYVSSVSGVVSTPNLANLVSTANLVNLVSTANLVNLVSTANLTNLVSTANLNNLVSTTYLDTQLASTVRGLGTSGYVSSVSGVVSTPNLINLVSTPNLLNLVSTQNLVNLVSTQNLLNLISSPNLISTTAGLERYISSFIDPAELASSIRPFISIPNLIGLVSTTFLDTQLASTVRGLGTAGYLSTIPTNLSTTAFFVSSILASTMTTSSLQVQSLTIGSGTGWVNLGPLQTVAISSIQANTNALYANTSFFGTTSSVTALQFYGLFGNYNNTVLAEVSTGAGTQEFLMFKGSSSSDRVRVQTTGDFVVETGVSARLFNSNTTQTLSNATPSFIVNSSSNVGIQTNPAAGVALDVAGTGRFVTLSSLTLFASSIVAPYIFQPQYFTF